jgi:hypothetical protein
MRRNAASLLWRLPPSTFSTPKRISEPSAMTDSSSEDGTYSRLPFPTKTPVSRVSSSRMHGHLYGTETIRLREPQDHSHWGTVEFRKFVNGTSARFTM